MAGPLPVNGASAPIPQAPVPPPSTANAPLQLQQEQQVSLAEFIQQLIETRSGQDASVQLTIGPDGDTLELSEEARDLAAEEAPPPPETPATGPGSTVDFFA